MEPAENTSVELRNIIFQTMKWCRFYVNRWEGNPKKRHLKKFTKPETNSSALPPGANKNPEACEIMNCISLATKKHFKNTSQNGKSSPIFGVNIKNIWVATTQKTSAKQTFHWQLKPKFPSHVPNQNPASESLVWPGAKICSMQIRLWYTGNSHGRI